VNRGGNWPSHAEMMYHEKVARRREHDCKRYDQDGVAPGTPTGRTSRMRRWIGPVCNSGIRDRGLKQKLQGSKRKKDLGGRLPLCPRNEKTSSWTYRKNIDSVKIPKQRAGSYRRVAENQGMDLVEVSAPLQNEKKKNCK
jgi:hypothetical protein